MAKDVKMFVACDHYVNERFYEHLECPRCYGRGYYFDIHFESGVPMLSEGITKLEQEILKILIEEKGSNPFHIQWGNDVSRLIGTKNTEIKKSKIEVIIKDTLDYLRRVQESEDIEWQHMRADEVLGDIMLIDVVENAKRDGYIVRVKVSTTSGSTITQTFNL